jgi:hypothetical protein
MDLPLPFLVTVSVVWLSSVPFTVLLLVQSVRLARAKEHKFHNDPKRYIIQLTTNSKAAKSVREILQTIRSYGLAIPYEIWVVAEERDRHDYSADGADRVLRVPRAYATKRGSVYKSRALEYARETRIAEGLEERTTKILFLDDDSLPTKRYIEYAYHAPYDLSQGLIAPRRQYGTSLLASVQDNIRTADCIGQCSFFNSMHNPRLVHGEGLVVKAHVEKRIGWDFGRCLAEDLVFGRKASKHFTFGFIPEYIQIAPPKSLRDFLTQRRRWAWGNISALPHLDFSQRVYVVFNQFTSVASALSTGIVLVMVLGHVSMPLPVMIAFGAAMVGWVGKYLIGCEFNTRSKREVLRTLLLLYLATLFNSAIALVALLSRPKGFETIAK